MFCPQCGKEIKDNAANVSTYDFPVRYEEVYFEIEQLFAKDPTIKE